MIAGLPDDAVKEYVKPRGGMGPARQEVILRNRVPVQSQGGQPIRVYGVIVDGVKQDGQDDRIGRDGQGGTGWDRRTGY